MGTEVVVPGVANLGAILGAILALAVFLWRVFGKRLDVIDTRLDKVDENFEKMEAKFDGRFDKVDGRLGAIDIRVGKLEAQYEGLQRQFGTLDGKVDDLAKDHQRFANELSEFRGEMHGRLGTVTPQDVGVAGSTG